MVYARQGLLLGVTLAGLALIALSSVWTTRFPPAANWSDAQAAGLAAVEADVARLYKKLAEAQLRGVEVPEEPIPLVRLLAKHSALVQERDRALNASAVTARKLRWSGVALLAAGVAVYFCQRS